MFKIKLKLPTFNKFTTEFQKVLSLWHLYQCSLMAWIRIAFQLHLYMHIYLQMCSHFSLYFSEFKKYVSWLIKNLIYR